MESWQGLLLKNNFISQGFSIPDLYMVYKLPLILLGNSTLIMLMDTQIVTWEGTSDGNNNVKCTLDEACGPENKG